MEAKGIRRRLAYAALAGALALSLGAGSIGAGTALAGEADGAEDAQGASATADIPSFTTMTLSGTEDGSGGAISYQVDESWEASGLGSTADFDCADGHLTVSVTPMEYIESQYGPDWVSLQETLEGEGYVVQTYGEDYLANPAFYLDQFNLHGYLADAVAGTAEWTSGGAAVLEVAYTSTMDGTADGEACGCLATIVVGDDFVAVLNSWFVDDGTGAVTYAFGQTHASVTLVGADDVVTQGVMRFQADGSWQLSTLEDDYASYAVYDSAVGRTTAISTSQSYADDPDACVDDYFAGMQESLGGVEVVAAQERMLDGALIRDVGYTFEVDGTAYEGVSTFLFAADGTGILNTAIASDVDSSASFPHELAHRTVAPAA